MKILFIDLRSERNQNVNTFPISALHILSFIRQKYPNIEYDIMYEFPESKKEIKDIIRQKKYDLFMFSTYVWNMETSVHMIREINKLGYGKVIVGGRNVSFFEEFSLDHLKTFKNTKIDFFIRGPAESCLLEVFDYLHGKYDIKEIKNIVYYDGEKYRKNPCDKKSNYSYFSYYYENDDIVENILQRKNVTNIEFSYEFLKGCPFKCSFCAYSNEATSRDYNNFKKVKKDLFYIFKKAKKYNARNIFLYLMDANFGMDHVYYFRVLRYLNILQKFFKIGLKMIASTYKNIARDGLYLLDYMIEKGFHDVYYFAVQSFSQKVLRANKRSPNPNFHDIIKSLQEKNGSKSFFTFELVLGLNAQTKKDFLSDLEHVFSLTNDLKIILRMTVYNLFLFADIEIKNMFSHKETKFIKNTIYYSGNYKRNRYFECEQKEILISNNYMNKYQLMTVRNFLLFFLFFNQAFQSVKETLSFSELKNLYFKFFMKHKNIKREINRLMREIFWNKNNRYDYRNSEALTYLYYEIFFYMKKYLNIEVSNRQVFNRVAFNFMTVIPTRKNKIHYMNQKKDIVEKFLGYST